MESERQLSETIAPLKTLSLSEELLLRVIFWNGIIYLFLTLLLIPFWYSIAKINPIAQPFLLLFTQWTILKYNIEVGYFLKLYQLFLVLFLVLAYIFLQVKTSSYKNKIAYRYVESYSIELEKMNIIPSYLLIPKVRRWVIKALQKQYGAIGHEWDIISISTASSQQFIIQKQLQSRIQFLNDKLSQTYDKFLQVQLQQLEETVRNHKQFNSAPGNSQTIWITFSTQVQKQLALKLFTRGKEPPTPTQIQLMHLHEPSWKMIASRLLSTAVCMSLLFIINLIILRIQVYGYSLVTSMGILSLEIVLKQIIMLVVKVEKHKNKSNLDVSIYRKLIKYSYINSTILIFINSYHFNVRGWEYFSTLEHTRGTTQWYEHTGTLLMLNFLIQFIYYNARLFLQKWKKQLINIIKTAWKYKTINIDDIKRLSPSQTVDLPMCCAYFISMIMFTNTYCYSHPVMIPLTSLFCLIAYYLHKHYFQARQSPSYNNDKIHQATIISLYFSLCMHLIISYLLSQFLPYLIVGSIGFIILIFRMFVGEFYHCKTFPQIQQREFRSLLGWRTVQKIGQLQNQIKSAQELYRCLNIQQHYESKQWLKVHINDINQSINGLRGWSGETEIDGAIGYRLQVPYK